MSPSNDQHELRTQRNSTGLFILLFTVSITILLLYTSLVKVTKTFSAPKPALEQYEQLYSKYSQTLTCSCTKISINYGEFIHINYTLHQVCSSSLVTKEWIDFLAPSNGTEYFSFDFRTTAPYAFRTLSTFCNLVNKTIFNNLIQFYSKQYITAFVTPSELFETEIQSSIDEFKLSITNSFLLSLSIIRNTTQANALYSPLHTNYVLHSMVDDLLLVMPLKYNDCNCGISSTCIDQSSIYKYPNKTRLFDVKHFYTGCYVIESLLQSTLECFYNQSCINQTLFHLSSSPSMIVIPLEPSLLKEYSENSTIQDVLNKLMIEEWNSSKLYDVYYNKCSPKQCSYILETRNDLIYIFTILFGVAGGLATILKIVVPRLIKLILSCIRKLKRRIVPNVLIA